MIDGVLARRAGATSGALAVSPQMGGSLGVAAVDTVLAVQTGSMAGLRTGLPALRVPVTVTIVDGLPCRRRSGR